MTTRYFCDICEMEITKNRPQRQFHCVHPMGPTDDDAEPHNIVINVDLRTSHDLCVGCVLKVVTESLLPKGEKA